MQAIESLHACREIVLHCVAFMCPSIICSSPCGDHIEIYSGMSTASNPVQKICSSSNSTFDVKLAIKNAYIRFQVDGQRGRRTGFRGTFAAQGEHCNLTHS